MKVVIASHNIGKIHEFRMMLEPHQFEIIPQAELTVPSVEETGKTFVENALIKARHASEYTKLAAIADDSGLVVPTLAGAPGIFSARYAGEPTSDHKNIEKLLQALAHQPDTQRAAYFYCALVFMTSADDPTPIICCGRWHGTILTAPQGDNGFGYDPIFFVSEHQCSAAELTSEVKNKISHRGIALRALVQALAA